MAGKAALACPGCGSKKAAQIGPTFFKCRKCGAFFDDDPNEGGDYGNRPEARIEREERQRERRRDRLGRRR